MLFFPYFSVAIPILHTCLTQKRTIVLCSQNMILRALQRFAGGLFP